MSVPVNLSSAVRASGPALATLIPAGSRVSVLLRAKALGSTDVAARQISPRGITLLSITPDEGQTYNQAQQIGSRVLPTVVWVGVNLALLAGVDRLPLPRVAKALALGSGIYALDVMSSRMGERLMAAAQEAKDKAHQAKDAAEQAKSSAAAGAQET